MSDSSLNNMTCYNLVNCRDCVFNIFGVNQFVVIDNYQTSCTKLVFIKLAKRGACSYIKFHNVILNNNIL